jgi:endonuclease V-like protein UPF0215 family
MRGGVRSRPETRYPRLVGQRISNVIGFDDAPFERGHRGDVGLVGVVFSGTRLDGVLASHVRRDGANATARMRELVQGSRFVGHVRAVLLQGIAVAGFNVVDVHALARTLGIPVLVVARRRPDLVAMHRALGRTGPGAARKWRLIERAGPMEPLRGVFVQRVGLGPSEAGELLAATTLHGLLPEPLRVAHLVAGGLGTGSSRGRA